MKISLLVLGTKPWGVLQVFPKASLLTTVPVQVHHCIHGSIHIEMYKHWESFTAAFVLDTGLVRGRLPKPKYADKAIKWSGGKCFVDACCCHL